MDHRSSWCGLKEIYRDLDKKLVEGTYGIIYVDFNNKTGKNVVLKICSLAIDRDEAMKILSEIIIGRIVKHENLMTINYSIYNETTKQVLLEYDRMDMNLMDYYQNYEYNLSELSNIFSQIAGAIQYLHFNGIIHRDIKSENILVKFNEVHNRYYLTDYNYSCRSDNCYDKTMATLYYCAPELLKLERPTFSCDIWSFGCVLVELLVKDIYFYLEHIEDIPSFYEFIKKNINFDIENDENNIFYDINKKCPSVYNLLINMLAFEPKDRFTIGQVVNHKFLLYSQYSSENLVKADKDTDVTYIDLQNSVTIRNKAKSLCDLVV